MSMKRNWAELNKREREGHLESIEVKNAIKIPRGIKKYCIETDSTDNNELINRLSQSINNDYKISLHYEVSEAMANGIVDYYNTLTESEVTEVISLDEHKFINQYSGILEYLLIEGISFYDPEEDKFNHPVLQKVYSKRNSDDWVIMTWLMWAHCGGFEGIILNSKEKGCLSIGSYGEFQSISRDGEMFEYYKYKRLLHQELQYLDWFLERSQEK